MARRPPIIAIDGPAGAGKSSVSRALADRLGMLLLDTGAIYRLVALAAQRAGVDWDDDGGVATIAIDLVASRGIELDRPVGADQPVRAFLRGEDVTSAIRTPEMSRGASRVSAAPAVRAALLDLQRQLGASGGVVVEGRDIGTVVFPDAEVKFFLTASLEERAERRSAQLAAQGLAGGPIEETLRQVQERDLADERRAVAPLRRADDAVLVDSTAVPLEEVVSRMERVVRERCA